MAVRKAGSGDRVQYLDERAEEDAEGDDRLRVDGRRVAVLAVEVADQSRAGHQSAAALAAHIGGWEPPVRKLFDPVVPRAVRVRCARPAELGNPYARRN